MPIQNALCMRSPRYPPACLSALVYAASLSTPAPAPAVVCCAAPSDMRCCNAHFPGVCLPCPATSDALPLPCRCCCPQSPCRSGRRRTGCARGSRMCRRMPPRPWTTIGEQPSGSVAAVGSSKWVARLRADEAPCWQDGTRSSQAMPPARTQACMACVWAGRAAGSGWRCLRTAESILLRGVA